MEWRGAGSADGVPCLGLVPASSSLNSLWRGLPSLRFGKGVAGFTVLTVVQTLCSADRSTDFDPLYGLSECC